MNTTKKLPTIKQANKLILAGQNISLQAKRLLYFMAKNINEKGENPKQVIASWREFQDYVQVREPKNWKGRKRILKKIFNNLNENPVEIETVDKNGKRKYAIVNWVQSVELEEDNETVEMMFTDKLIPFLIYLKGQPYTKTIYEIGNYKSVFTVRIKEILETEKWRNPSHVDLELEKLKWMLGVQDKYSLFGDFRRRVLERAKNELLHTNSSVKFTYDTVNRHGQAVKRNVHTIRFFPKYMNVQKLEETEQPTEELDVFEVQVKEPEKVNIQSISPDKKYPELYEKLIYWGLSDSIISGYMKAHGIRYLKEKVAFVEEKQNVASKAGLLITAIKKDFKSDTAIKKVADKKIRKVALKQAEKEQERKRVLGNLKSEYARKQIEICNTVLEENPELLSVGFSIAKEQAGKTASNYPKTAKETYEHFLYKYAIVKAIAGIFPDDFVQLYEEYVPKIKRYGGEIKPIESFAASVPKEEQGQEKRIKASNKLREQLSTKIIE